MKQTMDAFELIANLRRQNDELSEALGGLLDGLDANYGETFGLTDDQWEQRIGDARQALAECQKCQKGLGK